MFDNEVWIILGCCFAGIAMLILTTVILIIKLRKSNQLILEMMKLQRKEKKINPNSGSHSQNDENLDYSSFEEKSQVGSSRQNNSREPVIIFTQNPYYGESDEKVETNGAAKNLSQNKEKTKNGSSQNEPVIIFTSNPYYE